ncbi:MAG: site-specific integrase [Bacteroidota bacterium]
METFREKVEEIQWNMLDDGQPITASNILREYMKETEVKYIIRDGKKLLAARDVKDSTREQHRAIMASFSSWLNEVTGKDDILVNELTQPLFSEIEAYAREEKSPTWVHAVLSYIKSIYNHYAELGYAAPVNFKINSKVRPKKRVVLTMEEVNKLMQADYGPVENTERSIQITLDIFIFMIFSGLSYADTMALKYDDLAEYKGQKIIDMSRIKTNNPFVVPLFPEAERLIEKYRNYRFKEDGRVFPWKHNKSIYFNIKKIAKDLEIEKELSSHIARHTFATTICLNNNVDIESVSGMLGHKSIRTTQVYAKINKERILQSTNKLNDLLSKNK